MIFLIILGSILVAAGLAGLAHCIREAIRIRRHGGASGEIHRKISRLSAVNLASVALAALGLGLLTAGFILR